MLHKIQGHKVDPLIKHVQTCKIAACNGQFVLPIQVFNPNYPIITQGFLNNICSTSSLNFLEVSNTDKSILQIAVNGNRTKGVSYSSLSDDKLNDPIHVAFYNGESTYQGVMDFILSVEKSLANESLLVINNWKIGGLQSKFGALDAFKKLSGKVHFTEEIPVLISPDNTIYCAGIGVFLYEKKKVTYRANSTKELTDLINSNTPCVFLKYGDGEMESAIRFLDNKYELGNCDGTPYTEKLGRMMFESIQSFKDKSNIYLGGHIEEIWEEIIAYKPQWCIYHSIIVDDIENPEKLQLLKAIKENPRKKIYIGNPKMGKACRLLNMQKHIIIDPRNWFEQTFEEILQDVKNEIIDESNTMILTSAGMGAKPLVAELYKLFPNVIYIDLGSALDLICTGISTRGHHKSYDQIKKYLSDILPNDWDTTHTTTILFPNIGREGRLGNVMFQYAAIKAMAIEKGVRPQLPWNIDEREHHGQRCLLKYFKHTAIPFTEEEAVTFQGIEYHFPGEDEVVNREHYLSLPLPIKLSGHPESELFFKKYAAEIKKEFEFVDEIEEYSKKYIQAIRERKGSVEIVGIHIRRGDRDIVDLYTPWFRVFIGYVLENIFKDSNYMFLVFTGGAHANNNDNSSDIEWCKQNLSIDSRIEFCEVNDTIKDLAIMTKCDHMILTLRSTLSWWGAYLNKNPTKKIIVPKKIVGMPFFPEIYWSDEFIQIS